MSAVILMFPWFRRRKSRPWRKPYVPNPPKQFSRETAAKLLAIHMAKAGSR